MASSYGGISFHMLAEEQDGTLKRALFVPTEFGVVRTRLPYAGQEQIQLTGRGNRRMEIKCELYDEDDFDDLLAMVATGTARTLVTEWGASIPNVYLLEAKDMWRVSFDEEYHLTLVFELIG